MPALTRWRVAWILNYSNVSVPILTIKISQWARMNFCCYRKNHPSVTIHVDRVLANMLTYMYNQLIVLTNVRWQVPKVHSYQSKQQLKILLKWKCCFLDITITTLRDMCNFYKISVLTSIAGYSFLHAMAKPCFHDLLYVSM